MLLQGTINAKEKLLTGALIAAAGYIAVTCPCEKYLVCHRTVYLSLLSAAAAMSFLQ
jgi:hypothetical protein